MSIYGQYARVYDQSGQLAFSLKMVPYLSELLDRHPVAGRTVLELACGTGTVAAAFAHQGWRVYAVDGSAEMLAVARAKARDRDVSVLWSQQDMRHLVLPERVHLATCLYDSLNYMLTSEDLAAVFRGVYRALQPGGLFLFDMNTAQAFESMWNDDTYFTDAEDVSVAFTSRYDGVHQRTSVTVTCFHREGDLYRKIVEHHVEQAYPPEQIATLLTDAGFDAPVALDCFTFVPPNDESTRIMWLARRPASATEQI
jgi:ubiquinone/menaquinone biosynthesis C-methylase UbiE